MDACKRSRLADLFYLVRYNLHSYLKYSQALSATRDFLSNEPGLLASKSSRQALTVIFVRNLASAGCAGGRASPANTTALSVERSTSASTTPTTSTGVRGLGGLTGLSGLGVTWVSDLADTASSGSAPDTGTGCDVAGRVEGFVVKVPDDTGGGVGVTAGEGETRRKGDRAAGGDTDLDTRHVELVSTGVVLVPSNVGLVQGWNLRPEEVVSGR